MSPRDPLQAPRYATLFAVAGRSGDALREFHLVLQLYPDAPFVEDAHEAVEALDAIQIQQILMMAGEQTTFATDCSRRWKPLWTTAVSPQRKWARVVAQHAG
jgi:hypothetical protein